MSTTYSLTPKKIKLKVKNISETFPNSLVIISILPFLSDSELDKFCNF